MMVDYTLEHEGKLYTVHVEEDDNDWYLNGDYPFQFIHGHRYRGPLMTLRDQDRAMDPDDFFDWIRHAKGSEKPEVVPVYLYDHSGYRVSTSDFGDRWDSGLAGFLIVEKEDWKRWYGKTTRWRIRAREAMKQHIEMLDTVFSGEYYFYSIREQRYLTDDEDRRYDHDEIIESLGGIIGTKYLKWEVEEMLKHLGLPTRGWKCLSQYGGPLDIDDPPLQQEKEAA